MENLILLLTASLVLYKSAKRPQQVLIGDTGCSVLYPPHGAFESTRSDDGDVLYFSEHTENFITHGVLCAQLHESLPLEEAREVLVNYMSRLQKPFNAPHNTGIVPNPNWIASDILVKVDDYWQDAQGVDWKLAGYTDGRTIAVLYVKNIGDAPSEDQETFLDSFCFPR